MNTGATGGLDSIDALRAAGFDGFVTVAELDATGCLGVPRDTGVYLVVRDRPEPPRYLTRSTAPTWRGTDPTVREEVLVEKWVPGAIVLYVGRARGPGVRNRLQQRIKRCIRFGNGSVVAHWGGRYIWQLTDHRSLRFAWKPCEDPAAEEARLLAAFHQRHDTLPFANLKMEHEDE